MAQLERPQSQRQVDAPKTPTTIHTMEQLLRAGEASKSKLSQSNSAPSSSSSSSGPSSPFFPRLRHHDSEEDHGQNLKKSVLTKVKEKAKKLRHSLSKKRHEDGNASSPSAGAGLEGEGVEEEAEYLGAPMYESEKAPEALKENARQQQPRGSPVFPVKHVVSSNDKPGMEQNRDKTLNRSLSKRVAQPATATTTSPTAAAVTTSPNAAAATATVTLSSPNKTVTKTIAEKNMTPTHAEGSEAPHSVTSKMQGLTVSKPAEHHNNLSSTTTALRAKTQPTSLSLGATRTPPAKMPSQICSSDTRTSLAPVVTTPPPSPPASAPPCGRNAATSATSQIWDKGVSVKEYLMNKLEPGEDEKALSRVISEAMSPRRTPGDAGVMEKVREAVTSLLRNEEPTKYAEANSSPTTHTSSQTPTSTNTARTSSQSPKSTNTARASSEIPASTNTTRASSQLPVSSNAEQVVEEENHGRILQAN